MISDIFLALICLAGGISCHYAGFEIIKYALTLYSGEAILNFGLGVLGVLGGIAFYVFFALVGKSLIDKIKEHLK